MIFFILHYRGKDELNIVEKMAGNATSQNVQNANGSGRVITMKDSGDVLVNAVQLDHESYRDGVVTDHSSQQAEIINAVLAHSAMAEKMTQYKQTLSGILALEAALYKAGRTDLLAGLASGFYDSSADYWRLMSDGSLAYDGSGYLKDENEMYISSDGKRTSKITKKTIGAEKVETGLLNIFYSKNGYGKKYEDFTNEQKDAAQKLMFASGMKMEDGDKYTAQWIDDGKNHTIKTGKYMKVAGNTVATQVFMQVADNYGHKYSFGNEYNTRYQNYATTRENFFTDIQNYTSLFNSYANNPSLMYGPDIEHSDKFHKGNDNAVPVGMHLYSQFSGIPIVLDSNAHSTATFNTSGINVNFEIGYQFENTFVSTGLSYNTFHMDSINPNLHYGTYYPAGTYIGNSGNTGQSTGPHVHNEIHTINSSHYVDNNLQSQMLNMLNIPMLNSDLNTPNTVNQWNDSLNFYSGTYHQIYLNTNNIWGYR